MKNGLTRCDIAHAGVKRHNRNNAALKEGLEALGAHCAEVPRNCAASGHDCGHCGFGCASGGKQDASGTWLLDAVTAGARILTGRAPQGRIGVGHESCLPAQVALGMCAHAQARHGCPRIILTNAWPRLFLWSARLLHHADDGALAMEHIAELCWLPCITIPSMMGPC